MKKYGVLLTVLALGFTLSGCGDPCKEDMLTKLGDTIATLGKSGVDKDKILLERGVERAAKCTEKSAGDLKKNIGF